MAGKSDRQRFCLEPLALAHRADSSHHVLRCALFHARALAVRKGVQHMPPCAGESAHVAWGLLALEGVLHLPSVQPGIHRHGGLFVGEQNPVTHCLRQLVPGNIDLVAQGGEDVAQILPLPSSWPGCHSPFANRKSGIGHHRCFSDFINPALAVAMRTGTLRRVGRKVFRIQHRLADRIEPGA